MIKENDITTKPFYNTTIPSDWKEVRIKDIGKITSGTTPLRSNMAYHRNGIIPWVKTTDLNNSMIVHTEEKISELALKETSLRIYPKDTILVAMYGGFNQIGRTGILGMGATINQALSAISVNNNETDPIFLLNWLNAKVGLWKNLTGSSRKDPNITSKDVGDFPFLKIPITEQRAIAQILSLMDTAIVKNNQLTAKKELQKKWLIQNLLTGKKRLEGFKVEWKEVTMANLFERVTRKNSEVNSNVVTISAQRGFVRQTDFFTKSIASEIIDNYFLVEKGEFCYNKSYSNGYPWGATKRLNDFDKAVVTTLYICFRLKNLQKSSGDFFEQYFEANLLDRGLTKIAHEGGRAHGLLNVTPSDFFSLKITVPNFEEQTAIAQVLQAADKEIQLLKAKTEKLREQKKGMMQVLLTGKIRVKNIV
ncbi:MAG TPA: restriction endonuclease subunit S [Paludibacter sp.]